MSAGPADEQTLELSPERATLLRGALNVGIEMLDRDFDPYELGLPLRAADRDVIDGVNDRLQRRIEQRGDRVAAVDTISLALAPAEVQAVNDVLESLESLIANEYGREVLARVGYIVDPGSDIVRADLEHIDALLEVLDPPAETRTVREDLTAEELRDMTRAEFRERRHGRESESRAASGFPTETIDGTKPVDQLIADARHDVEHGTINHPGLEQLSVITADAKDNPPPGGCEGEFRTLVELVLLAAGTPDTVPREDWDVAANHLLSAHQAVLGRLVQQECIGVIQEPENLRAWFGDVLDVLAGEVRDESAAMPGRADEYLKLVGRIASGAGHARAAELGPQVERLGQDARRRVASVYAGDADPVAIGQVIEDTLTERRQLEATDITCRDIAAGLTTMAVLVAKLDRAGGGGDARVGRVIESIRDAGDTATLTALELGCVLKQDAEGIERAIDRALDRVREPDVAARDSLRDYLTVVEEAFKP